MPCTWNNTSAVLGQDPGSLLPKGKDRFMIKGGILHGADTRHKAVHCRSEVEAMEILKTLNFLKQQHCTHKH